MNFSTFAILTLNGYSCFKELFFRKVCPQSRVPITVEFRLRQQKILFFSVVFPSYKLHVLFSKSPTVLIIFKKKSPPTISLGTTVIHIWNSRAVPCSLNRDLRVWNNGMIIQNVMRLRKKSLHAEKFLQSLHFF